MSEARKNKKPSITATIENRKLQEVIKLCQAIVHQAKIVFDNDGMHIKAVDPDHISMLKLDMHTTSFEEYSCDSDKPVEICVDLYKLLQHIRISKTKMINIVVDNYKHLCIEFNAPGCCIERHFRHIDTTDISNVELPNVNPPYSFSIDTSMLKDIVKAISQISDHLHISFNKSIVIINNAIDDINIQNNEVSMSYIPPVACEDNKGSMYPLDLFKSIIYSMETTPVKLSLGVEYPLQIDYVLSDGLGTAMFLLAPWVE